MGCTIQLLSLDLPTRNRNIQILMEMLKAIRKSGPTPAPVGQRLRRSAQARFARNGA
jgi:hypothetical protein